MKKFLVIASFFLSLVLTEKVMAIVVTENTGNFLVYQPTMDIWSSGEFSRGLSNTTYSVEYTANVYDNITNQIIVGGATVSVGTVLRFEPVLGGISFVGTGTTNDTPLGVWEYDAAFPDGPTSAISDILGIGTMRLAQCSEKFYTNFATVVSGWFPSFEINTFHVFVPFSVNPPIPLISRDVPSQAKLNCTGNICTVIAPGTITTRFLFPETYAKFWYEYKFVGGPRYDGGLCHIPWDELPMRLGSSAGTDTFSVSQAIIFHTFTAVSSNNAPTAPSVTPQPFNGNTNTAYPFTFTSTDPDNDQIAYEVDWNNDSLPDEGTPFVSSSTSQSLSNPVAQWLIAGTYSFKVRAKDNQGGVSSWTTPSVTLTTIVNGVCGLASGLSFDTLNMLSPGLCASGTQASFLSTGTGWTWGCNGSGGGTSTLLNACSATTKTYILSAVKNLGPSAAGTIIDTTPTAMSIDSTIPRNTESVPYNSSRTLSANPTSSSISWSGCTSVSGNDCIVNNIIADKTVTATFTRLPEPGICGSSDGQSFETLNAGSSGLCSSGAIAGFSLSGQTYSWNCNGSFGSPIDVSCSASQIRNYNWKEVSP